MLNIDDFKPIQLEDKKIFEKLFKDFPPAHSDYLFTTMISWKDYANYNIFKSNDNLVIYSNIDCKIRFRPPLGKRNKKLLDQVIDLAKKQNSDYPLGVIDLKTKEWIKQSYPNLKFKKHRNYSDYVYLASDLADLKGSDYSKIRNRLNKFRRLYDFTFERINASNMDEVKKFLKRWCLWKDCESDFLLKNEKKAILFSFGNFDYLGLSGTIIRVNGRIEAMAVFEKMNYDTAVVHYEKASPDFFGIYKIINQETAKLIRKDFKFINRESDMGYPGLRRAKMSYRPHHLVDLYHIPKENLDNF